MPRLYCCTHPLERPTAQWPKSVHENLNPNPNPGKPRALRTTSFGRVVPVSLFACLFFFATLAGTVHTEDELATIFTIFLAAAAAAAVVCLFSVGPRPPCQGPGWRWLGRRRHGGRAAAAPRDRGAQGHDRAREAGRRGRKEESQGFRAKVYKKGGRRQEMIKVCFLSRLVTEPSGSL